MQLISAALALVISVSAALAQNVDPAKLNAVLQAQRNNATDAVAQCSVLAGDQQARISELEKQIAELKAK